MSTAVDLDLVRYRATDDVLACQISGKQLRRLVRTTVGLSDESIELLTQLSERLRTAEGALPDPAMI
ncbi:MULTISPECIES: hypothetical protein [Nocardia]|uniref:Uncharacterized protein n=1 Tax=Nocardia aurea TaxID=2144174 RepID=A0ABV3FTW0_9NOCA|nr:MULTISPECIES: hypothetical protein [Nocardia]